MRLNKKIISEINMGGRGGGEKVFAPALTDYRRVSKSLYDFVNEDTQEKIELKKQKDLQWFDGWKYHNLSEDDRNITMMFVMHDGQKVSSIYSVSLGAMIDALLADAEYNKSGWTADVLESLNTLKNNAPKVQSKLPLKLSGFIKKYRHLFTLEYDSPTSF